jgi:hypothetical protein
VRILIAMTIAAAAAAALLPGAVRAPASAAAACTTPGWHAVTGTDGRQDVINSDNWGGGDACLSDDGGPDFTITSQDVAATGSVLAYPNISIGCYWAGTCSAGSGLPVLASALTHPVASWSTTDTAPGVFDTAFDIWFGPQPYTGPSTEIMIFINGQGLPAHSSTEVTINGVQWWLTLLAPTASKPWQYVQFRRATSVTSVKNMPLMPFFSYAEKNRWLSPGSYLWQVAAGFELWSGGAGLASNSFSVSP